MGADPEPGRSASTICSVRSTGTERTQSLLDSFAPALEGTKPVPDAVRAAKAVIDQILTGAAK